MCLDEGRNPPYVIFLGLPRECVTSVIFSFEYFGDAGPKLSDLRLLDHSPADRAGRRSALSNEYRGLGSGSF